MDRYNAILYVADIRRSVAFYGERLKAEPVECSANFALFALPSGGLLGLWGRHDVAPPAGAGGGGFELFFPVADRDTVDATYGEWTACGCAVAQQPETLDFGYSFVVLDPDDNRLRVCFLSEP